MYHLLTHLTIALWFLITSTSALSIADIPVKNRVNSTTNQSLTISTDGTCGSPGLQTCQGSVYGNCCSINGFCGNTTAYCLVFHGCQSEYGDCLEGSPNPNTTTPSYDGMCGDTISCAGGPYDGECCSAAGYCGSTDAYCQVSNGCQQGLGFCKQISPDGTCGGNTGYSCVGSGFGVCCSSAGWCGSDSLHCGLDCQGDVGPCLAPTPNGSCGWDKGYTCLGSSFGECCSASGWCGNTTEYCSLQDGCNVGGIDNPSLGVCLAS